MLTESLVIKICEKYSKTTLSRATLNEDSLQFHAPSASEGCDWPPSSLSDLTPCVHWTEAKWILEPVSTYWTVGRFLHMFKIS